MKGRRSVQFAGVVAVLILCVTVSSSATAANNPVLRGFGTANVDGVMTPGEWDPAGHADFTVNRAAAQGGGTVLATVYVMNDATNLYLAVRVLDATIGASQVDIQFGSRTTEGSEYLGIGRDGSFKDMFVHQVSPNTWQPVSDVSYGGTSDGAESEGDSSGYSFYELVHPLNDADDAHDFSLAVPTQVAFNLWFIHCSGPGPTCAEVSRFPAGAGDQAEAVVVSGSRVAPETQITSGPAEGSITAATSPEFGFTGTDEIIAPSDLTFECKLDEDAWRSCASPLGVDLDDGRHTFSVRALDEMLNVDATPVERHWAVDTTGPSKPIVRGPRSTRKSRVSLRFSARDEFTPKTRLRFKCAVDSTRLHRCSAVYRVKLRPGRHLVRVRAIDRLGNQSELTTFRMRVKRGQR
jgi:hypothetical protein